MNSYQGGNISTETKFRIKIEVKMIELKGSVRVRVSEKINSHEGRNINIESMFSILNE